MNAAPYRFLPAECRILWLPAGPTRACQTPYPILTTCPPVEHSFGPMPLAGAMLQFET
jgi:hypothetical protein